MAHVHVELFSEEGAPVIVMFGMNPGLTQFVCELIAASGMYNVYGVLSEEAGVALLHSLPLVSVVVIAPPYDVGERARIKAAAGAAPVSEPGVDYELGSFDAIVGDVARKAVPLASRGA